MSQRSEALRAALLAVYAQRDEIIKAFIAKYNCGPDEIEQVEQHHSDGSVTWHLRRKESTMTKLTGDASTLIEQRYDEDEEDICPTCGGLIGECSCDDDYDDYDDGY